MNELPIKSIAVYKHGVGYYTRRSKTESNLVKLKFPKEHMDDILKSITTIDYGKGQILGIDFETAQNTESKLSRSTIDLGIEDNLIHLISDLQGKKIILHLENKSIQGVLVGIDESKQTEIWGTKRISILDLETSQVSIVMIGDIKQIEILDSNALGDLQYYLNTVSANELYSEMTIRLDDSPHDLVASYIAPAPIWTVNYRFICGKEEKGLVQGWAIFHNSLDEDLKDVKFSFITGMPISFIYKLYNSFTPERPMVEEDIRTVEAPIEYSSAPKKKSSKRLLGAAAGASFEMEEVDALLGSVPDSDEYDTTSAYQSSVNTEVETSDREESFQYKVKNPVSVERGKSAMIPILSSEMEYSKIYMYNKDKFSKNPSAILKFKNSSGLILEKGPIMILDEEGYLGEGILEYTTKEGEALVAYSIDLSVKVYIDYNNHQEINSISLKDSFLIMKKYEYHSTEYKIANSDMKSKKLIIEHPMYNSGYELIHTIAPLETLGNLYRFEVELEPSTETICAIKERKLVSSSNSSYLKNNQIKKFIDDKIISSEDAKILQTIQEKYEEIDSLNKEIKKIQSNMDKILKKQAEVRKNIETLKSSEEKEFRQKFVQELMNLNQQHSQYESEIPKLEKKISELEKEISTYKFGK
ncbi:MAG: hypothetical protein SFU98_15855 [Leptospiraceae bacterium]|nr:hypothetical protein [Leptospiraceae bacterium]